MTCVLGNVYSFLNELRHFYFLAEGFNEVVVFCRDSCVEKKITEKDASYWNAKEG